MGESSESFWNPGDSWTSGAMTERLYYRDSFLREFEAQVVSADAVAGKWHVQLDRTAFYPTSGGQPNDLGRLGSAAVLDVFESDGHTVVHVTGGPVAEGPGHGAIDWERRFDHMQQHTGQHLLSAAFVPCRGHSAARPTWDRTPCGPTARATCPRPPPLRRLVLQTPARRSRGNTAFPSLLLTSDCRLDSRKIQRSLPCLAVLVARARVEQHHGLLRVNPLCRHQLARRDQCGRAFRRGVDTFECRQFPARGEHLFTGGCHRRAPARADHPKDKEIPQRLWHAQAGGDGRCVVPEFAALAAPFVSFDDGRAARRLHRDHARPGGRDPAHRFHLVKGFAHSDQPNATTGGIDNHIRQLPSELLPQLVPHRLLAFDAVGLF